MRILITEVTEMHQANYCVAGWCAASAQIIRPLPNGANWVAQQLIAYGVIPGATVEINATGARSTGCYPHLTEDLIIDPTRIRLIAAGPAPWFGANAPPAVATLSEAFAHHVQHNSVWNGCHQGVHVPVGTQCRSLWAVELRQNAIRFIEDFEKLKAVIDDTIGSYKLPVSSHYLKHKWRSEGIEAVNQSIPAGIRLHVRVGLARAFGTPPNKCYVMINGVNF